VSLGMVRWREKKGVKVTEGRMEGFCVIYRGITRKRGSGGQVRSNSRVFLNIITRFSHVLTPSTTLPVASVSILASLLEIRAGCRVIREISTRCTRRGTESRLELSNNFRIMIPIMVLTDRTVLIDG